MKTIMRCLVLTLALAVGAFAETRMIEIPNLDKFQSSRYKTLSFAVNIGMKSVFFNTFVLILKKMSMRTLLLHFNAQRVIVLFSNTDLVKKCLRRIPACNGAIL